MLFEISEPVYAKYLSLFMVFNKTSQYNFKCHATYKNNINILHILAYCAPFQPCHVVLKYSLNVLVIIARFDLALRLRILVKSVFENKHS